MNSEPAKPSTPQESNEPLTDSPWFWLIVFTCGSLAALVLTIPKYSWRQPQIERQYQAREISGMSVSPADGRQALSQPGNPMLTLNPLFQILVTTLVVSTILFWWIRGRRVNPTSLP